MPENQTLHLNAMNRAKNFSARVDSLPSRVIILGSHAFLRAMYETFRGIHPTRQPDVHFLTTWAEAERFLSQPR